MSYKLGSLFDGSGGFPLAGSLCGITPVWASEVEPYPIAVTRTRFPAMKHLGDISKINGAEIEPVDIITFGSPCQDLSVAGKRAGLKHEANGDEETTRSGLFMEAVRIIKEMREATNGEYPRYALWENVPGAFSSNKGEDFRIVLEELIKVVEPTAVMPEVPKSGWAYADSYSSDGWPIAYRVFDAQHWGVPQRRRRIHLVADFRGQCAGEVLFKRDGVRGHFAEGRTPWQGIAGNTQRGFATDDTEGESTGGGLLIPSDPGYRDGLLGGDGRLDDVAYTLKIRSGCEGGGKGALVQENKSATLATNNDQYLFQPTTPTGIIDNIGGQAEYGYTSKVNGTLRAGAQGAVFYSVENHPADSRVNIDDSGKAQTLTSRMGTGGGNVPMVMESIPFTQNQRNEVRALGDKSSSLMAAPGMKQQTFIAQPIAYDGSGITSPVNASNPQPGDPCHTLSTDSRNYVVTENPVYCLQGNGIDRADTAGCNGKGWREGEAYTLNTIDRPAVVYSMDRAAFNQGQNAKYDFDISDSGVNSTLVAKGPSAVAYPTYTASKASFFMRAHEGSADTLVATDYKDPPLVTHVEIGTNGSKICNTLVASMGNAPTGTTQDNLFVRTNYIVRRLTPTECARLQGFPDRWGDIEAKDTFTQKEYQFWLDVRNTHATINGKTVKDYSVKQMLTWYNKLQTDSAEYKMWGNGIALPPALYVMQGIVDALEREEADEWML